MPLPPKPTGTPVVEVNDAEVLANPFLGPEWLPLIEAIAPNLKVDGVGRTWGLEICTAPYTWGYAKDGYGGSGTQFLQAINEADGSLHLELGTYALIQSNDQAALKYLEFSGWNAPQEELPIHFRILEPGWNPRHALYVALQAMVHLFKVTSNDIFMPMGAAAKTIINDDRFDTGSWHGPFQLAKTAYALKGVHELFLNEPDQATKGRVMDTLFSN